MSLTETMVGPVKFQQECEEKCPKCGSDCVYQTGVCAVGGGDDQKRWTHHTFSCGVSLGAGDPGVVSEEACGDRGTWDGKGWFKSLP